MRQTRNYNESGESVKKKCQFCVLIQKNDQIFLKSEHFIVRNDKFPIVKGHLLVIPKRHISSPIDLNDSEWGNMRHVLEEACLALRSEDNEITAFNIGINVGADAGQTIAHMHIHVIPRRPNDIPDSRCGVRMVNPSKADYLTK